MNGERAGEVDALAHAARKLAREIALEARQPDELQEIEGAAARGGAGLARDLGADQRIGQHASPRQEIVGLEHEAAIDAGLAHHPAVEPHLARAGRFEPGDDAQERGLAAARGADDRDEFALGDRDADIAQHLEAGEGLA